MNKESTYFYILQEKIKKFEMLVGDYYYGNSNKSIESLKSNVIEKFFDILRYNAKSKQEVIQNYQIPETNFVVDYALFKKSNPYILVVTTEFNKNLSLEDLIKLENAFNSSATAVVGMITNGVIYQLYQSSNKSTLDRSPFLVLNGLKSINQETRVLQILFKLSRSN